ncbi:MAG: hypothetical protein CVV42_11545 [Candidatus Riflebacteria bacterium HGW-Riflebacteria-2]|jgi:hypothetical protein|nr:MAG: hypothetical protein CVV42_11545 [Candidatus Riflebacteria bacterium HGW-Riflebacteria-2]
MKHKRAGIVLASLLLLLNLHFQNGVAEGNDQQGVALSSEVQQGTWIAGAPIRFKASESYQSEHFLRAARVANEDKRELAEGMSGRKDSGNLGGLDENSTVRTVIRFKDSVVKKLSPVLENPDGKLFMPLFNARNEKRLPQQDFSGSENSSFADTGKEKSDRSAQERYFVGYRLGLKADSKRENWYIGLGWKNGGGGNVKKSLFGREKDDSAAQRSNIVSYSEDVGQNAVKVQYSGPILGLVGEF